MSAKRFTSRIDRWILLLLVAVIVGLFAIIVGVTVADEEPLVTLMLIGICLLAMGIVASMLVGTHYTVDGDQLRIASGPFRWKVDVASITSVEPTRNPVSSPALSLDRLRIRYGGGRSILVSPADAKGFRRAIGQGSATATMDMGDDGH